MSLSRREFLRLAGLVASGITLASCSPLYRTLAQVTAGETASDLPDDPAGYLALRRLTYGPTPEERQLVARHGIAAWVEEQLAPEQIDDGALQWRLRPLDYLELEADALLGYEKAEVILGLKQATLLRKIYSRRQLYEQMVEFWSDHFNISVTKSDCWFLKPVDDRQVIRAHALGNFGDLLMASAHSPAMLMYLDNQANHRQAPNENYARELMELHTLGVDGGYAQEDVMELARGLTGWTVKDHFWRGEFTFNPDLHDHGAKKVLDLRLTPGGVTEGETVLEHLATHPATAHHIATKLARRFLSDEPTTGAQSIIERATQTFLSTHGDLRSTLRVVLLDGLAGTTPPPPKFKQPLDFIASALRTLGAETNAAKPLHDYLAWMGQPLFEWPTPDGPPDVATAWTGNLLPRWKFALELALNDIPGTRLPAHDLSSELLPPAQALSRLSERLLGSALPADQAQALLRVGYEAGAQEKETLAALIAGLLASPAFQWR